MLILSTLACGVTLEALPAPDDWQATGPGLGPVDAPVGEPCAVLAGGEGEAEHHNLVVMHDGYLLMPWAPEWGHGGISFFDMSDPCEPVVVGEAWASAMRESHTLAFGSVGDREYLAVDSIRDEGERGGVGIWDITDREHPEWVSELDLPGFRYPEAYFNVSLSTFWQGDELYVSAGLLGTFVVDVSDPLNPVLLEDRTTNVLEQVAGSLHVIGTVGMSSSAGTARTVMWDLSTPGVFEPISGGDWDTRDDQGVLRPYYFANVGGEYGLFARKNEGGGPIVYDISDPGEPTWVAALYSPEGDGGYIFRHEDLLFQGESNFAAVYDFSDPSDLRELQRFDLQGDLDTVTPIGPLAVLSVDEKGEPGVATTVVPWTDQPDARGPVVSLSFPQDGDLHVPLGARIGLSFDELLESASVHPGSVRVWDQDGVAVPGRFNVQESIVNFTPDQVLLAETTYFVEVPADGVADSAWNGTGETWRMAFSTGELLEAWPEVPE
jgi:hypothetical protein